MSADALPDAWMVISAEGFRALFLDRARAEQYASKCHGTLHPLFKGIA